jgi:hypothetical protein
VEALQQREVMMEHLNSSRCTGQYRLLVPSSREYRHKLAERELEDV